MQLLCRLYGNASQKAKVKGVCAWAIGTSKAIRTAHTRSRFCLLPGFSYLPRKRPRDLVGCENSRTPLTVAQQRHQHPANAAMTACHARHQVRQGGPGVKAL